MSLRDSERVPGIREQLLYGKERRHHGVSVTEPRSSASGATTALAYPLPHVQQVGNLDSNP